MRLHAATDSGKGNGVLYALAIFMLIAGITAGSVYLAKNSAGMEGIKEYLEKFFASFSENRNNMAVFKNSLISNLICAGIIFVMGFFRIGCIGTGAMIIRKGFIMGFTSASFFKFYGGKGILIMLSTMPTVIITLPALIAFSAISVRFSLNENKLKKNLIFSYIFFLIVVISIFCVASLSEGFLTTTFMTWLSPKIT